MKPLLLVTDLKYYSSSFFLVGSGRPAVYGHAARGQRTPRANQILKSTNASKTEHGMPRWNPSGVAGLEKGAT